MKGSPCFECEERHMRCHAECEKYKAFKQGIEEDKQKVADYREKYYITPKIISGKTAAEYYLERRKEKRRKK